MDVFLYDNPQTKMVIIDSIEKIVESETGQMEYNYVYNKLCALKKVASIHGIALLVVTHAEIQKDNDRLAGVADTVLEFGRAGKRSRNKHMLHVERKNVPQKEIAITFEAERCRWKPVTTK